MNTYWYKFHGFLKTDSWEGTSSSQNVGISYFDEHLILWILRNHYGSDYSIHKLKW